MGGSVRLLQFLCLTNRKTRVCPISILNSLIPKRNYASPLDLKTSIASNQNNLTVNHVIKTCLAGCNVLYLNLLAAFSFRVLTCTLKELDALKTKVLLQSLVFNTYSER